MRRRNILIGTLAIAVVVATIGGVAYVLHTTPYPGLHGPVSVVCPGRTYHTDIGDGSPAIHPRNDCTPSFTQQDVRDYVVSNGVSIYSSYFGAPGTSVVGQPTVTRVVFLTVGELDRGGWLGWGIYIGSLSPADMLVCYAGFTVASRYEYSFGLPHSAPVSVSAAYILFDAHTGNRLGFGQRAPLG